MQKNLSRIVIMQAKDRRQAQKLAAHNTAQKELLAPLDPEKAYSASMVEVAADEAPEGSYYFAQGTEFKKVLIPLGIPPV